MLKDALHAIQWEKDLRMAQSNIGKGETPNFILHLQTLESILIAYDKKSDDLKFSTEHLKNLFSTLNDYEVRDFTLTREEPYMGGRFKLEVNLRRK